MEQPKKFQGLKNLHQNLHSRKGLTNLSSGNLEQKHALHVDGNTVDRKQEFKKTKDYTVNLDSTLEGRESKRESNSLLKAVKSVYTDKNVKLTQPKIFVGNISYNLSTAQLKDFFSSFGRVIFAQIIKDRVKKRSKGYGFVTFSSEHEVERVLKAPEDELILDGRTLRVNRAEKKRRSRPIRESSVEKDPKKSLEDFVQKYLESNDAPECDQLLDNDTDMSIAHLNDDVLMHIFMMLTMKDRVKIERVCQRWRNLARQTWTILTHLDFKGVFVSFRGTGGLTDRVLLSLFKRGCQNLRSLDLSHSARLLSDYSLYLIGQNCPHLEDINLSGVNVTMKSLKEMSGNCRKLTKVMLQRCFEVGEKALWWLFKHCTELEYIDIAGNIRVTGQCFFMLTEKCKVVIADDCMKLTDSGLQFLTKKCSSLQELSISNCLNLTNVGITDMLQTCTKLRRLSFCKAPKTVTTHSLLALRHLTDLEELELAMHDSVNDSVLFVIGSNFTRLRLLNLEACHHVTDQGIQCLKACSQLQELNISYLDKLTDASLESIAQNGSLRKLSVRSCDNITDQVVQELALHCPDLQELDLSGAQLIRNRSLDVLEEYLGSNEVMVITVGGTGITMERALQTRQRHPGWDITTQNLSDYHLRADFDPYMDVGCFLRYYSDSDSEEGPFQFCDDYDVESYLTADDPSMWEFEEEWMS